MIDYDDATIKTHYERFVEDCHMDATLDLIVWENFSNFREYEGWKYGRCTHGPYKQAFETVYEWDGEYFIADHKTGLIVYLARDRRDKIDKLSEMVKEKEK